MAIILSLDIGTNSIGWALIDDVRKRILRVGVRIFPEGVDQINTSKEKTRNAARRTARGMRRANYRYKLRRKRLKRVLKELGMLPNENFDTIINEVSKEKNYFGKKLYRLRKDALDVPLNPEDLGRIFLQINNHRGFKSNKKEDADKEFGNKKDADNINTLEQKTDTLAALKRSKEKIEKEITELRYSGRKDSKKRIDSRIRKIKGIEKEIEKVNSIKTLQEKLNDAKEEGRIKYGTIGEYYYSLIEKNNKSYNPNSPYHNKKDGGGRLRNNDDGDGEYTTREIFENEFDLIWSRQQELNKNNPNLSLILDDANKKRIKEECIFYQRDLRSQKHLVDRCNYEYTAYLTYKFNNNDILNQLNKLRYLKVDSILGNDQKEKLFKQLKNRPATTVGEIRNLLDLKTVPVYLELNDNQKNSLAERLKNNTTITVAEIKKLLNLKDEQNTASLILNLPDEKTLERDYLRCCHKSSLEFQEFRIWEQVNNLRYIDEEDLEHSLTIEQKNLLVNKLFAVKELTIETHNKSSIEEKEDVTELKEAINLPLTYKFKEIKKLKGNITLFKLKDALDEDYWDSISIKDNIPQKEVLDTKTGELITYQETAYSSKQRQLYNNIEFATSFIKSIDWLKGEGKSNHWKESIKKLGLTANQLSAYSKITFEPDYCSYSSKAIKKLLPWMKQGLNITTAAEKIGYEMASDERRNENYLHDFLPTLKNNALRNPIVQKGASETFRLINIILKEELKNEKPDKIHIEMARELKKPKEARVKQKMQNDEKEKERKQWADFLKVDVNSSILTKFELFLELEQVKENFENLKNDISVEQFVQFCKNVLGKEIKLNADKFNQLKVKLNSKTVAEEEDNTDSDSKESKKEEKAQLILLKYRLWLECGRILPYTNEVIGLSRLLGDNSDIQIEHIIPYSRCMDNSFLNKTLSTTAFNTKKGNLTPIEYFANDEKAKKAFMKRVGKIDNEEKQKRFLIDSEEALNTFRNSQIRNTAYIATEVKKHLLTTFRRNDIEMTNGQITALLRKIFGFDTILNPPINVSDKYENGKYWAILKKDNEPELIRITKETATPTKEHDTDNIIEGNVANGRFYPKKQRNDHRHHAIDAIAIGLSSKNIIQIIERNTEGYFVKNGKRLSAFEQGALWESKFDEYGQFKKEALTDIKNEIKEAMNFPRLWPKAFDSIENLLISYNNKNLVTSSGKKKVYKNGKVFYSGGNVARGALHEDAIYGKTENLKDNEFVKRIKVSNLTWSQILNIADSKIKSILIKDVSKYAHEKFSQDKAQNDSIETFVLTFEELVELDMKKTFYEEEIKALEEVGELSEDEKGIKKELVNQLEVIKRRLNPDKERNKDKKGKRYKDYLEKGFKEAMKAGFFIENNGKKKDEEIIREPVPIKRVRVKYISNSVEKYKGDTYNGKAFIKPGENFCMAIYGDDIVKHEDSRLFKTITLFNAASIEARNNEIRKQNIVLNAKGLAPRQLEPLFEKTSNGKKLLTYFSKKDMFLVYEQHPEEVNYLIDKIGLSGDEEKLLFDRLYRIVKADITGKIGLAKHNMSGVNTDYPKRYPKRTVIKCNWNTFKGIKVIVDHFGKVHKAEL